MEELYVTIGEFVSLKGEKIKVGKLLKIEKLLKIKKKSIVNVYVDLQGNSVCDVNSHNGQLYVKKRDEELKSEEF